ncbi:MULTISPECIES: hypothetical protein [unclassified Streptomyces]|uniref:hypothetical protein n=1 Tax=unclassified Streptomyces TaxID=2593676 RepID=UPI00131B7D75|nr:MULTISPECIES: hypothetical protein [unclassified Streptomyces]MYX24195.1 hypothetical protein [Streptomyces sp. SID8380]
MDRPQIAERILAKLLNDIQRNNDRKGLYPDDLMDSLEIWPLKLWGGSEHLQASELIKKRRTDRGRFVLTSAGEAEALRLQKTWNDRGLRSSHLHETLLYWIRPGARRLEDFNSRDESWFCGRQFSSQEIKNSANFLADKGLATVQGFYTGTKVEVTPDGKGLVDSGRRLVEHMQEENRTTHVTNNYNKNNFAYSGSQVGAMNTGDNASLHMQNGIPADRLADLVRQLREITPDLNLGEDAREEYLQRVGEISAGAADPEGTRGRFREIAARYLSPAIEAGAGQAISAAFGSGLSLLGLSG